MRVLTRVSTAHCDAKAYVSYLLSDPLNTSCLRLATLMEQTSHDSINRFLVRERFTAHDLYNEVATTINPCGGTLSIDDSVLDKPYSDPSKAPLIGYHWSGKHHAVVKGCNIITLFYTDLMGARVPVNYRIYDKSQDKTKNDYFLEMLEEVLAWGLKPAWVTGDAWYASLRNLKQVRKSPLNFLFGIEANRLVSLERGHYLQAQALANYPKEGLCVYLTEYGSVKLFKQAHKDVSRYYIIGVAKLETLGSMNDGDFEKIHQHHWHIECFHRAIKQVCHIEHFQVRTPAAVLTPIHCALLAFVQLELMTIKNKLMNWYQLKREMFNNLIKQFVSTNQDIHCPAHSYVRAVNA